MPLTAGSSTGSPGRLVVFILGTIVIIVLAYYVTYLVSRGANKNAQAKAIKILDRRALSKDKLICIIEVADKVYLVAMTDGGVSLLDTLNEESADHVRATVARTMPAFSGVLQKGINKGFSAILERRKRDAMGEKEDLTPPPDAGEAPGEPLETAQMADDLDEMFRKINVRREKKKTPPEGGRDE